MKNNAKSPADEFEVGKPAPVAAKAEAATLPAPKKTFGPIGLPKPNVPQTIGGGSPAPNRAKEAAPEKFPDDLKSSLELLTKLQGRPDFDLRKNNALLRRVEALGRHVSKLQQLPAAPTFDAHNLQIGPSAKRRRALADKLR
jgi:hypothetical protein